MITLPSRAVFNERSRRRQWVPVAVRLPLESSAQRLFEAADFAAPKILLESARAHPVTGRYSIIVGEPTRRLLAQGDRVTLQGPDGVRTFQADPLRTLQRILDERPVPRLPGFPPFVGGAVGLLGFELHRIGEPLSTQAPADLQLPDACFLFCDDAVVLDHREGALWVIALAPPEGPYRYDEAVARVERLARRLIRSPERGVGRPPPFALHPSPVASTHSRASFEAMVRRAQRFIAQGEIYQVNLSQRFAVPLEEEPWALYRRLQAVNPSPFSAFADLGSFQVVSASPERLLRLRGRRAETRPIAGTRPRGRTVQETRKLREELLLSGKERAEHLMLVDLERNDLGRVCRYGSVRVDTLMALEEYSHVLHIISNVQGLLSPGVRPLEAAAALFPGGTITGCPKIRAIRIIGELEPVRRHFYTGSLGYVSYTGDMDLNLLIRTAFVLDGAVTIQAGAGIVADSDPGLEFEETLHKAQALLETFRPQAALEELSGAAA